MNPDDYQRAASRTECDQRKSRLRMMGNVPPDAVDRLAAAMEVKPDDPVLLPIRLNHASLGIAAEGGEMLAEVQRYVYYGKDLNRINLKEELGDVLWYVAEACNALGLSMADVMEANIAKLKKRYPEKYSDHRAAEENRDRAAEARAVADEAPDRKARFDESAVTRHIEVAAGRLEYREKLAEAEKLPCTCPSPDHVPAGCAYHAALDALPVMKGYVPPHPESTAGREIVRSLKRLEKTDDQVHLTYVAQDGHGFGHVVATDVQEG